MARPYAADPKSSQVNVRLTTDQAEGLATIEYLDGISGPEFLRSLLAAELARRLRDPSFVETLRNRQQRQAELNGGLVRLQRPRPAAG